MNNFELDSQLSNDCYIMGEFNLSLLLLMNNSLVPWFILVPQRSETEIVDLPHPDQAKLLKEINLVSTFIKNNFHITKLNVAAIGNIVKQLHVHVVGRESSDFCWPNVIWGTKENKPYTEEHVTEIIALLSEQLGDQFTPHL